MDSAAGILDGNYQPGTHSIATDYGYSEADRKDLRKAAGQFEAIFYRQILKSMRESSLEEDPLLASHAGQQFKELLHDQLADYLGAQGALGFRELFEEVQAKMEGPKPGDLVAEEGYLDAFPGLIKTTITER